MLEDCCICGPELTKLKVPSTQGASLIINCAFCASLTVRRYGYTIVPIAFHPTGCLFIHALDVIWLCASY
jgi:hypothetical protein